MMHWHTHQQSSGSPLLSGQLVRCRRQKTVIFTSIFVVFVFALKCATVERSAFWRDLM